MNRTSLVRLMSLAAVIAIAGCDDDDNTGPARETFRANLTGAAERPTPRTTPATGTADFVLEGDQLSWTITMSNITNVTAAHIHIGGAEDAGGVILPLTPGTTGVNNTLIAGSINRSAFTAPSPPNANVTFDSMLQLMRSGGAYVNVHTNDPTNPPDTGPGDFPAGEIRGQITKVS